MADRRTVGLTVREVGDSLACFQAITVRPASWPSVRIEKPQLHVPCGWGFSMRQARFERATFGSGGQRSIQLSYWRA